MTVVSVQGGHDLLPASGSRDTKRGSQDGRRDIPGFHRKRFREELSAGRYSDYDGLGTVTKTTHKPEMSYGGRGSMILHELANMSDFQPPAYWTHYQPNNVPRAAWSKFTGSQTSGSVLVTVDKATFNAVDTVVQRTWEALLVGHGKDAVGLGHRRLQVKQVERLEHPELFKDYCQKRSTKFRDTFKFGGQYPPIGRLSGSKYEVRTKTEAPAELQREIYPEVNEHYLFYGTNPENVQIILNHGLDPLAGAHGMMGSGIHCAENATKADQYTDSKQNRTPGDKQMLLMRVTLGQPFVTSTPKNYSQPPCRDMGHLDDRCSNPRHGGFFDSVIADGPWNFREFVVYEGSLCYPEYIITYARL